MAPLRSVLKSIASWITPRGIAAMVKQSLDARSEGQRVAQIPSMQENARYQNLHKGKRCFIIASGPSIKTQDLTLLKDDISIAVSNSFVHKDYSIFKSQYHCVPDMLGGHHEYIAGKKDKFAEWLREMDGSLGQAEVFMSAGDRNWISSLGIFKSRRVNYLLFENLWESVSARGIDLTRAIPSVQSVSVMALQVAIYMGFEKIYLLGCDHDWILNIGTTRHFYASQDHKVMAEKSYSEWAHTSFSNELRTAYTLWEQYRILNGLAEKQGTSIFNATGGGVLDVFPLVSFASLFAAPCRESNLPQRAVNPPAQTNSR
jgi:hypothetical protein